MHKDSLGHNWVGSHCVNCGISAWREKAMWPCHIKPQTVSDLRHAELLRKFAFGKKEEKKK